MAIWRFISPDTDKEEIMYQRFTQLLDLKADFFKKNGHFNDKNALIPLIDMAVCSKGE